MSRLELGNTAPLQVSEHGHEPADVGRTVTTIQFPDGWTLVEKLNAAAHAWPYHSADTPDWVESDDETLASAAAEQFGCKQGRPKRWR
jgi:hypothetical protein